MKEVIYRKERRIIRQNESLYMPQPISAIRPHPYICMTVANTSVQKPCRKIKKKNQE